MQAYTFLCIRRDGSIPAIDIQALANTSDALSRVPQLFDEHASCDIIEIWAGSERLHEARRAA